MSKEIINKIYHFGESTDYTQDDWLLCIHCRKKWSNPNSNFYGYLNRRGSLYYYLKEQFKELHPTTNWRKLTREIEQKRKSIDWWEYLSISKQRELETNYHNQF